ncbi:metal-dependent hydrolase [Curvibacter sp. HBC28]|uniref:Metal-dependent hydrolase n=1 Tax=Curvibacter microcysteis TaxID=3026419 RepID=A0ABT5MDG9_9BURK|nr:metal-dependent hydrolase [Curvibacter sp. HBC28]MDD0814627.1 metal-dependent hydrolase [Curvibacter sp. HBC28]
MLPTSSPASAPPELRVRKLEVDLGEGFPTRWHGGDAFRSMFFNALSMSFPVGEQFFIDSVREALKKLPEAPEHEALRRQIQGFIGQEATHRRVHGLYNEQLAQQGLVNRWQHWAQKRIDRTRHFNPMHHLAVTCAYEHFTAVLADITLRHADVLDGADDRLQTVWRWHAAEETEHSAVAFALYQALGGNHAWRVRWFTYVLITFIWEALAQTVLNLWHDGSLARPSSWWSALCFGFGRQGLVWRSVGPLLRYYRRDFHPDQPLHPADQASARALAERWLNEHASQYRVVGAAR